MGTCFSAVLPRRVLPTPHRGRASPKGGTHPSLPDGQAASLEKDSPVDGLKTEGQVDSLKKENPVDGLKAEGQVNSLKKETPVDGPGLNLPDSQADSLKKDSPVDGLKTEGQVDGLKKESPVDGPGLNLKKDETNRQFQDLFGMVQSILNSCAEDKQRCEEERRAAVERPSTQDIMDELQRLRDFFESLTNAWRDETDRRQAELLETVRSTANVQVPFNVQGYLDEFGKSLATEVRMLLSEVGKLREERRNIQFELGTLLSLRSKYESGGMFDPDWKPSTGPLAPQPPDDLPPDEPSGPPPESRQGAWRPVHQRSGFRRGRRKAEPRPPGPVIETTPPVEPPPDRVQTTGSWATWQVQPGVEYTPSSSESSIHLVPEPPQPPPQRGLFVPRSPRSS